MSSADYDRIDRAAEHLEDLLHISASHIHRRFAGYVDKEDLIQELRVYVLKRPHLSKMLDEAYEVSKDETKWVARRIMARFRRTVEKYARKEKAAKLGYSTGDEFFYDTLTIAKILPVAFEFDSYGAVMVDKIDDGTPRKPSVPSEGGNILAVVIDIRSAIDLLEADEQVMLRNRYSTSPMTLSEIAQEMGISDSTVDRKIQGSLRKIIDHLGGPTPWV